jgi:hypothetical protein
MMSSVWPPTSPNAYLVIFVLGFVVMLVLLSIGLRLGAMTTRPPGFIARNLVLRRYEIRPNDPMHLVHMVGRKAGFWGWLWSDLGIAKSYEMHISDRFVMVLAPGIGDGILAVIPIDRIVTVAYEYRRPMKALVIALVLTSLVPVTIAMAARLGSREREFLNLGTVICIIGAVISYLYYGLRREIRVLVSAGDGFWGFHYLVGAAGSFEKAAETVNIVRNLITTSRAEARRSS